MMICYEVNIEDGQWNPKQSKLEYNKFSTTFCLNQKPINAVYPIGIQKFTNYFYIFWSPQIITAISDKNWDYFTQLLASQRLASVKIPDKKTQMLAMLIKNNENGVIHCGTFNNQHDCIICVKEGLAQIINVNQEELFKGKIEQFYDGEKKIRVQTGFFYFWKDMEYLEIKTNAIQNIQLIKNQIKNAEVVQQKLEEQRQIEEEIYEQDIQNQNNQNYDKVFSKQKQKYQMIDQSQEKTARKPQNRQIDEQSTLKKQKLANVEYEYKPEMVEQRIQVENIGMQEEEQREDQNAHLIQEQSQSGSRQQQSMSGVGQSSISPILDSAFMRHIINYNLSEYRVQLCGLNGSDVIDIRTNNQKQLLYYNKFVEGNQAQSYLLCELKYENEGQTQKVITTKLLYDPQSDCVYYNDIQRCLLHSYSLKQNKQESYNVKKPIMDMAMFRNGLIICINQNQILKFDTTSKKVKMVVRYKSVWNLSKISNIFMEFYYAIASTDGMVRTYDIRKSHKAKALNKFKMPKGITSLQVSSNGGFILCKYGHKAQILYCKNKDQSSVFESRIKINERKSAKNLVKGYERLSHIQFMKDNQNQGDVIAVDDSNPCRLILRNIEISQKLQISEMEVGSSSIHYLNCCEKWVIYGIKGTYYRQLLNFS